MLKVLLVHNSSNEDDRQLVEKLGFNYQSGLSINGIDFLKIHDMRIWTTVGVERYGTISRQMFKGVGLVVVSPNMSDRVQRVITENCERDQISCWRLNAGEANLSKNELLELMRERKGDFTQEKVSNLLLSQSLKSKSNNAPNVKYSDFIASEITGFIADVPINSDLLNKLKEKNHAILKNGLAANNVEERLKNLLQFIHSHTDSPESINSKLGTYTYSIEYNGKSYNVPWSLMHAYNAKVVGKYDDIMVINGLKEDLAKPDASKVIADKLRSPMYGVLYNNKYGVSEKYVDTVKSPTELYKKIKYSDKKIEFSDGFKLFDGDSNLLKESQENSYHLK